MSIDVEADRGPEQKINYTELAQVPSNWVSSVVALGIVLVVVSKFAIETSRMAVTASLSRLRSKLS